MIAALPPLLAGCCLLFYWGAVVNRLWRFTRRKGRGANLIPPERIGRWLRLVWIPTIVLWCAQPWIMVGQLWREPGLGRPWWQFIFGLLGAVCCALATAATTVCWREMGKSWRVGIDPGETTQLIVTGPFGLLRHPIYALSMVLVLGTLAATPTRGMLLLALLHIGFVQFEARREEAYLLEKHGAVYRAYMKRTGRFLPRRASHS